MLLSHSAEPRQPGAGALSPKAKGVSCSVGKEGEQHVGSEAGASSAIEGIPLRR